MPGLRPRSVDSHVSQKRPTTLGTNRRAARARLAALVSWGLCAVTAVSLLVTAVRAGEVRTWRAAKGSATLEAEFVELTEGNLVVLKAPDGTTKEVPLDKLSEADQQYVDSKRIKSIAEVEGEARKCRTAKDAVMVYTFYLSNPFLPVELRTTAEANLAGWKDLAAKKWERLGEEWMPKEAADKKREEAKEKFDNAIELLRLGQYELSHKALKEASAIDPDSIKADFLMGVVFGLMNNDKTAAHHFRRCLERDPTNVSVMNNLAVSLVFTKNYAEAARQWQAAAAAAPTMSALSQNIGSLLATAGQPGGFKVPKPVLEDMNQVYADLTTRHGQPRPAQIRFVYTPPYGVDWDDEEGGKRGGGDGESQSVVVGSGSGFVVHSGYVVTNHHVVEGASGLLILDPANPSGDALPAELVASSEELDIAVIRCKDLKAPAVVLCEELPPRGSDIMVLGYPLGSNLGVNLKSTRGSMVAMPDDSVDGLCLYDALTNPGNSGGPLCDRYGRVAAVVRAVTGDIGGRYGMAIPLKKAMPYIREHVPGLAQPQQGQGDALDWPDVDARVSPSTVLIYNKQSLRGNVGVGGGRE